MTTRRRRKADVVASSPALEPQLDSRIPLARVGNIGNKNSPSPTLFLDDEAELVYTAENEEEIKSEQAKAPRNDYVNQPGSFANLLVQTDFIEDEHNDGFGGHGGHYVVEARDDVSVGSGALLDIETPTEISSYFLSSPRYLNGNYAGENDSLNDIMGHFQSPRAMYCEDDNNDAVIEDHRLLCSGYFFPSHILPTCDDGYFHQATSPVARTRGDGGHQHCSSTPRNRSLTSSIPWILKQTPRSDVPPVNTYAKTLQVSRDVSSSLENLFDDDDIDEEVPVESSRKDFGIAVNVEPIIFNVVEDLIHGKARNIFFGMLLESYIQNRSSSLARSGGLPRLRKRQNRTDEEDRDHQNSMSPQRPSTSRRSRLQRALKARSRRRVGDESFRQRQDHKQDEVSVNHENALQSSRRQISSPTKNDEILHHITTKKENDLPSTWKESTSLCPVAATSLNIRHHSSTPPNTPFPSKNYIKSFNSLVGVARLVLYLLQKQAQILSKKVFLLEYQYGPPVVYCSPENRILAFSLQLFAWIMQQQSQGNDLRDEVGRIGNEIINDFVEKAIIETDLSREFYIYAHSSSTVEDLSDDDEMFMEMNILRGLEEELTKQLASASLEITNCDGYSKRLFEHEMELDEENIECVITKENCEVISHSNGDPAGNHPPKESERMKFDNTPTVRDFFVETSGSNIHSAGSRDEEEFAAHDITSNEQRQNIPCICPNAPDPCEDRHVEEQNQYITTLAEDYEEPVADPNLKDINSRCFRTCEEIPMVNDHIDDEKRCPFWSIAPVVNGFSDISDISESSSIWSMEPKLTPTRQRKDLKLKERLESSLNRNGDTNEFAETANDALDAFLAHGLVGRMKSKSWEEKEKPELSSFGNTDSTNEADMKRVRDKIFVRMLESILAEETDDSVEMALNSQTGEPTVILPHSIDGQSIEIADKYKCEYDDRSIDMGEDDLEPIISNVMEDSAIASYTYSRQALGTDRDVTIQDRYFSTVEETLLEKFEGNNKKSPQILVEQSEPSSMGDSVSVEHDRYSLPSDMKDVVMELFEENADWLEEGNPYDAPDPPGNMEEIIFGEERATAILPGNAEDVELAVAWHPASFVSTEDNRQSFPTNDRTPLLAYHVPALLSDGYDNSSFEGSEDHSPGRYQIPGSSTTLSSRAMSLKSSFKDGGNGTSADRMSSSTKDFSDEDSDRTDPSYGYSMDDNLLRSISDNGSSTSIHDTSRRWREGKQPKEQLHSLEDNSTSTHRTGTGRTTRYANNDDSTRTFTSRDRHSHGSNSDDWDRQAAGGGGSSSGTTFATSTSSRELFVGHSDDILGSLSSNDYDSNNDGLWAPIQSFGNALWFLRFPERRET